MTAAVPYRHNLNKMGPGNNSKPLKWFVLLKMGPSKTAGVRLCLWNIHLAPSGGQFNKAAEGAISERVCGHNPRGRP